MKLLQKYFKIIHEIYEYFDYSTNDRILPLEDYKEFYWKVKNKIIYYSANKDEINDFSDNVVAVYVGEEFTMVNVLLEDGEESLFIFDNLKKI